VSTLSVPTREFTDVRYDLEQTFLKLKATKDPERKEALLRQLRFLLREMHHLAGTTDEVAA
jgi:hypothetical protein